MNIRSLPIILIRIATALAFIAAGMIFFTPTGTNLWFLLTETEYRIPEESSVFVFRPTLLHPGEGDWWIYGADGRAFYNYAPETESGYRRITRDQADEITGFDPLDAATW